MMAICRGHRHPLVHRSQATFDISTQLTYLQSSDNVTYTSIVTNDKLIGKNLSVGTDEAVSFEMNNGVLGVLITH